jgi:hypothetical protein
MIFRALNGNDWTFGSGLQSYLNRSDAISANIKTRLQTFLGECFFATDFGVDWWNLLGKKGDTALRDITLQCRKMVADSYGVVRINSLDTKFDSTTRSLSITFNIDTIYTRNLKSTARITS